MSRFQWSAVAGCVLLNVLGGFAVPAMGLTSSTAWTAWGAGAGPQLPVGLAGMAAGSLLVVPWADRFGRRRIVLGCLAVVSATLLLSAALQSGAQFDVLWAFTGVGVGGILACCTVIAAEYASHRRRGLAISLNVAGHAVGATAGGAALFGDGSEWRSVFVFCGVAAAVAILLVWWRLPESPAFLLGRRPPDALQRINALADRMDLPRMDRLPEQAAAPAGVGASFRELVSPGMRRSTLLLWIVFFCVLAGFHVVTSRTAGLLADAGVPRGLGIPAATALSLGGIVGAVLFGLLAGRTPVRNLLIGNVFVAADLLILFHLYSSTTVMPLVLAVVLGAAAGLAVTSCVAGVYALSSVIYGPALRTTGVGAALAVGHAGSLLAPMAAEAMLDRFWTTQGLVVTAAVLLLGTAAVLTQLQVPGSAPRVG